MFGLTLVTLSVFLAVTSAKFPDNPKPCAFGDTTCIQGVLSFLLDSKYGGYSALNLIPIDPLKVASIDIVQGKDSPVSIDLRFRNAEVTGLRNAKVLSVKGFGQDLTQKHEVHVKADALSQIGDYKLNGKILVLPVQGSGFSNITFVNTDVGISFSGTPETKPDGTYLKIKKIRVSLDPEKVLFDLTNLFNGDKALHEGLGAFVNENWKAIYREVRGSIENAFAQVMESVINNVFQKYPYEKFFAQASE